MDIINKYPYLFSTLLGTTILLVVGKIFLTRQQWRAMIWSGLFSSPCFPFLVFFEKEYWMPVRLGGWILGLEDMIVSFWVAALSWFTFALSQRNGMTLTLKIRIFDWRTLGIAYLSIFLFLLFYFMEFGGMNSLLFTLVVVAAVLIRRNKKPWLPFIARIVFVSDSLSGLRYGFLLDLAEFREPVECVKFLGRHHFGNSPRRNHLGGYLCSLLAVINVRCIQRSFPSGKSA